MTIRTVVTVALAAAILGASLPAVERARVQHADTRIAGEVERLERAAVRLAATNDPVRTGTPARERLTLRLPVRSWGAAGVARFRVPPPAESRDVVWRVRGGKAHSRLLRAVRLAGPAGGLRIDAGGRQRVVLELGIRDGRRTVLVRLPRKHQ